MKQPKLLGIAVTVTLCLLAPFFVTTASLASSNIERSKCPPVALPSPVPTNTLTTTHYVYLPLSITSPPPLSETLKSRYLFVEHWTYREGRGDCGPKVSIDFPGYSFDNVTGILSVFFQNRLEATDIGYLGTGLGLGGTLGCGVSSHLTSFAALPLHQDRVTLRSVDPLGTVSIEWGGLIMALTPGTSWTMTIEKIGESCVISTTEIILNRGFQERRNITYR
jgi:hypothetical protein